MLLKLFVSFNDLAKDLITDISTAMYHGFDWYGRLLEVREVSESQIKS